MPNLGFQQLRDQAIERLSPVVLIPHIDRGCLLLLLHDGEEFFVALIFHLLQ